MIFRNIKQTSIGLTLLAAISMVACSGGTPFRANSTTPPTIIPLPQSMKGYELYSWQTEGQWHFALMTGTNRLKSFEEITTGPDTVTSDGWVRVSAEGVDELKSLLGRLPAQETIVWVGKEQLEQAGIEAGTIALPPQEMIDNIRETCEGLQLELMVGSGPSAGFMLILDARRSGDNGAQHVAIRVDAQGASHYEVYDSGGSIRQDAQGMVVYDSEQVVERGRLALDADQLKRLSQVIDENHFFDLTEDYRMQIGLSYAFVLVQTSGRRHQVFNIGMEVPAIRAIVETVGTMLPEGIGVEYGHGYVP